MIVPAGPVRVALLTTNDGRAENTAPSACGATTSTMEIVTFGRRKKLCVADGSPAIPSTTARQRQ